MPPAAAAPCVCAGCSSSEPSYSANYEADGSGGGAAGSSSVGVAAVPDLEGVDESLFMDDDLPEDDEIE